MFLARTVRHRLRVQADGRHETRFKSQAPKSPLHFWGRSQRYGGCRRALWQDMKWSCLDEIVRVATQFPEQRFEMRPRQQPERDGFDAADGSPHTRSAVTPDCRGIPERRKGDVMKQIERMRLVQLFDDFARGTLPQDVVH